jgi:hypothetical protein
LKPSTEVRQVFFSIPFFKWENPRGTWVLKSPFILYWEITMPMTALLMVVSLWWFSAMWLQDRRAAMKEREKESNTKGAAVIERDQRERTVAEDNVAAEILRERYTAFRL